MCGCSSSSSNNVGGVYVPPVTVQTCLYTVVQLQALEAVCDVVTERGLVTSQINTYNQNCNGFQSLIVPLLNKYNIP